MESRECGERSKNRSTLWEKRRFRKQIYRHTRRDPMLEKNVVEL